MRRGGGARARKPGAIAISSPRRGNSKFIAPEERNPEGRGRTRVGRPVNRDFETRGKPERRARSRVHTREIETKRRDRRMERLYARLLKDSARVSGAVHGVSTIADTIHVGTRMRDETGTTNGGGGLSRLRRRTSSRPSVRSSPSPSPALPRGSPSDIPSSTGIRNRRENRRA